MRLGTGRTLSAVIGLIVAVAIAGVAAALWSAYAAVRAGEKARLESAAATLLKEQRDRTGLLALDYAHWDEAWTQMSGQPDLAWVQENIGAYLTQEQGVHLVLLVDAEGRPRLRLDGGRLAADPPRIEPGLAAAIRWTLDQGTTQVTATIIHAGQAMHLGAAPLIGHTEAIRLRAGDRPDWLVFLRPVDQAALATALDAQVTLLPAHAPAPSPGLLLEQPGPAPTAVRVAVQARMASRHILWQLGLPLAGIGGLLAGLGWWAARLVRRDAAQRRVLEAQHQELVESRAAITRFVEARAEYHWMMAHELRTPLTVISTCAEMLESQGGIQEGRSGAGNYLRYMGIAVTQLQEMVEDLLDLARVAAGRMEVAPRVVGVGDLITRVAATLAPQAAENGVALQVAEAPPLRAVVDPHILERVVYNAVSATMREVRTGGTIRVEVAEGGAGEVLIILSGPLDGRTGGAPHAAQLGLGLPYCEAMLAELGGRLEDARDTEPGGIRRTIALPAGAAAQERGRATGSTEAPRLDSLTSAGLPTGSTC